MQLRKTLLPSFNGVASPGTATIDLPLGKRYHAVWLKFGDSVGTTLASGNFIREIRVKIDGKVQRTMTGIELNAINTAMGAAFAAKTSGSGATLLTYLPIWFCQPWRKTASEVEATCWNAIGIDSFQIEVDIATGLSSVTLSGYYEWDIPTSAKIGVIQKWVRQTFPASGTEYDITTLPRKDFLEAIFLFPTVGGTSRYVNKARLVANGENRHDMITTLDNQAILLGRELNPDVSGTPRYDLILDYDDPVNSALPAGALNELNLHVEWSGTAAGTMVGLSQTVGAPD